MKKIIVIILLLSNLCFAADKKDSDQKEKNKLIAFEKANIKPEDISSAERETLENYLCAKMIAVECKSQIFDSEAMDYYLKLSESLRKLIDEILKQGKEEKNVNAVLDRYYEKLAKK